MAIDPSIYRGVDTQYGLKLADLLNPAAIQQRQAAAEAQNMGNQLRQMQVLQGVEQMRRAPVLARREEQMFQAQLAEALRKQQEQAKRQAMLAQLPEEQRRMIELGVSPEKALLPEKPIGIVQELRAAGISETSHEGQRILRQRLTSGGQKAPMAPVAYVDEQGNTVWGTITEAKGRQAANYSPFIQAQIAGAKATGGERGKAMGEAYVSLEDMQSTMPRLEKVASELSELGKRATYTTAGKISDVARRELGLKVGEGAIARKEYISKVDNEILPLLRQTFGAAFTQKEGESLKATLGDPDASPEEKDAVLKSFIETKYGQIAGLQRRVNPADQQPQATAGGAKFLGFE